jgi:hypothetical protein
MLAVLTKLACENTEEETLAIVLVVDSVSEPFFPFVPVHSFLRD